MVSPAHPPTAKRRSLLPYHGRRLRCLLPLPPRAALHCQRSLSFTLLPSRLLWYSPLNSLISLWDTTATLLTGREAQKACSTTFVLIGRSNISFGLTVQGVFSRALHCVKIDIKFHEGWTVKHVKVLHATGDLIDLGKYLQLVASLMELPCGRNVVPKLFSMIRAACEPSVLIVPSLRGSKFPSLTATSWQLVKSTAGPTGPESRLFHSDTEELKHTASMTSQTQPAAPFSRFSRVGFGMGLKSRSRTRDSNNGAAGGEDEWYIPYNGPYEAPREPPPRRKARDSWGNLVGGEDNDAVLVNAELHNRYGGYARGRDDERKSHTRDRTHSVVLGGTPSSGEPSRTSIGMRRRSTVSGNRPTVPSYVNLGNSGGVGESPTPHLRTTKEANRLSFASIFSFGSGRKSPTSSPLVRDRSLHKTPSKKVPRLMGPNTSSGGQEDLSGPSRSPALRRSSSTNDFNSKSPLFERQRSDPPKSSPEVSTPDDEDYYNSYYSTLIQSPQQEASRQKQHSRDTSLAEPFQQRSRLDSPVSRQSSTSPTYSHPYAYAFPTSDIPGGPQTAPLIPTPTSPRELGPNNFQQQRADPPRLTFTNPHIGNGNADTHYPSTLHLTGVGLKQLKNSASTPNLRSPSPKMSPTRQNPPDNSLPPTFILPKGKDRWLSAETWCDALLFPRPRLKVKQDENGYVGSGRIVSPPGTPLVDEFGMNHPQEQGVLSRVLAHSRSLVDLNIRASPSKSLTRERVASTSRALDNAPVAFDLRPPRPTSFAQDDLALLSPPSSLSKVLAEATKSFENKRSRSISRTRSKSLTQKGRREAQPSQTGLDFLAARAYLGNQSAVPVVVAPKSHRKNSSYSATGTTTTSSSRPSHSHTGSLVKTLSKSSKSHSRGHSRTGEDAAAPCAVDEKATGLEGALRREGTKFIQLADPAKLPVDKDKAMLRYSLSPIPRVSPTPSGIADTRVGIALSTPPPMNEESLDHDSIRLPAHPYAQGGLYSFSDKPITPVNDIPRVRGSDYAGPHPSRTISPRPEASNLSSRHKLPPHLGLHPYAQTSARDDDAEQGLVPQARSDSNIPPQSKMWAQLSPGVVREILPGDIQYSPFSPDRSDRLRSPAEIHDIIGVGEALAYTGSRARSGSNAEIVDERSSTPSSGKLSQQGQRSIASGMQRLQDDLPEFGPRARREAVLYDARRPVYAQNLSDSTPSSLEEQPSQQLTIPVAPQASTPSPAATSESSPHLSPRPLGSPNDLENFHDLFYKPSPARRPSSELKPSVSPPPQVSPAPWEVHTRNRRTGSGLTSLARQLSEEFEQMALERERTSSQYSYSASSVLANNNVTQRPADGSLRFVFEGSPHPESPISIAEEFSPAHHPTLAFKPSGALPEDVESSRASSVIPQGEEEDDDDTAMFRVGMVESVSTPLATDHRLSFMGQTADVLEPYHHSDANTSVPHARVLSGLQLPVTEGTRSSYMTTSTFSRMSGLSDFPIPPRDPHTPRHMSLLTSYFDEAMAQNEIQFLQDSPMPHGRRLTFGVDQDAEDVAEALSSDSHAHP
ncbi:uncharacterized protein LACBIDRAFT_295200 [Laccaria bicolor S238N-H82]|uniref:Predicted protein n=1 Tax=Laccaria bicolor (strain S238N-H82 / ATCC MYA-4686) TaxID=486041 RepID=B0DP99_LACBS|nr:uncharacterized protein LACBIDRAFT_295200 [Laccaria bicolor S238N-H82]EDR03578.1 predicted protein [Laccaria bicolor S238N-H82]|eukprot:XP_001885726.1 predicted protein [Laccaria bicolor S238N-H82]